MDVQWAHVLGPSLSPWEIIVRGTIVYLAVFFLLRFTFKRETGSTSMTNLLVLVVLADAAQNAMSGSYSSVSDGLLLVGTIVGWSIALDAAAYRWKWAARLAKPRPLPLVEEGRVLRRNMRRELITEDELRFELRERGVEDVGQVRRAFMEPDGQVSVILYEGEPQGSRRRWV